MTQWRRNPAHQRFSLGVARDVGDRRLVRPERGVVFIQTHYRPEYPVHFCVIRFLRRRFSCAVCETGTASVGGSACSICIPRNLHAAGLAALLVRTMRTVASFAGDSDRVRLS